MQYHVMQKTDFAELNTVTTKNPSAMLCYALCRRDDLPPSKMADSPQNIPFLETTFDLELFVCATTGRDVITRPIIHDNMQMFWKKMVGQLFWAVCDEWSLWDILPSPYLQIPLRTSIKIELDSKDMKFVLSSLLHVVPGKKIKSIFDSCNSVLENDDFCYGAEIRERATWLRQTCINEAELRSQHAIKNSSPEIENHRFVMAIMEISLRESLHVHYTQLTFDLNSNLATANNQIDMNTQSFNRQMDAISAGLDAAFEQTMQKMLPLQKIASRPPRQHGLADQIRDPHDFLTYLFFGQKALASTR